MILFAYSDAEVEAVEEGDGGDEVTSKAKEKEPKDAKPTRKWQASQDRWTHDRFEESEQAPKSRNELVSAYGYDIRSEDGPPKARRRRRYGKGPNKYTRNWEDEAAYAKQTQPRKPRPEDFPALGSEKRQTSKSSRQQRDNNRQSSEYKENNDRNIERNEERRSHGGGRGDERNDNNREQRRNFKDKSGGSTSNHRRSQNNQRNSNIRNDNYRSGANTLEFINQNRNKVNEPQKNDQISHRYASQQQQQQQIQQKPQQQQQQQQPQSHQQNSNYHSQMHNVQQQQQQQSHYHQSNQNSVNDHHKESISFANARLGNQRYQNENVDESRYHQQQMSNKDQPRQSTPITQNQQQQQQQVIQPTPQQLQNYVQMQAAQQQKVQQQLQQMSQVQAAVQSGGQAGDPSRSKRYSSLRQRTGMENVPQSGGAMQQATTANPQQQQQQMIQDQSGMMSEAAILQQLQQNEKLKQMQSTLAHQKQISYHQAITPQSQAPASASMPIQNASGPQYPPPPTYYAQTGPSEYQTAAAVQQAQAPPPVQTQQPQMIASPANASAQYAQYAPQNTPSYIQNAYLPQQPGPVPAQPPPQMYVPSIQPSAPQTQFQPQFSGYTPNFTPQATTNQTTPIYQNQPPPSITYFAPTAATNPPQTRVTRRPTNAIPILAPPERTAAGNNGNNATKRNEYETGDKTQDKQQNVGSAENIDHILDNMFVRRPPLQPAAPMIKSTSPSIDVTVTDSVKVI